MVKGKKVSQEIREKLAQTVLERTPKQKQKHQQAYDAFNKLTFSKPTQILDGESLEVLGTYPSLIQACRAWNGDY